MNENNVNDGIKVYGITNIWKGTPDNLYAEHIHYKKNAIFPGVSSETTSPTGFKSWIAENMVNNVDRALDDRFTTQNSSGENGNDGIALFDELGQIGNATNGEVAVTTVISTTTPFARKFRGVYTSAGPQQFSAAAIGHAWSHALKDFGTKFATQSFQTVILGTSETLTVEWELVIA